MDAFCKEFNDHFTIIPATDAQLVAECQRLRYQIFCTEHQIFSGSRYESDLELDEFDGHSVHSLLRHKATGTNVATVRLVLADPQRPQSKFPLETHLGRYIYADPASFHRAPRVALAEISRFAVSREFRLRSGERNQTHNVVVDPDTSASTKRNRQHPYVTLGLFKAVLQMSLENDVSFWCAAMEPTLMRLLSRFGIRFSPIGPVMDYYGLRQPCTASMHAVLQGIFDQRPDVWSFVTNGGNLDPHRKMASHS
ncbi:MAG: PEP-CTERM/exosortase system-associated acyltransferase [Thiogranum sp.]|nr:PEP-CTERM/exosortase system-associated acyltransferase [Thiogranum sp.]